MAQFTCDCGNTLSNTRVPNDVQIRVFTDREFDNFLELYEKKFFSFPKYDVWRCPKCEMLHVFEGDLVVKKYVLKK